MTHDDIAIEVDGLRMRYGTTDVLHDVTFQARRGEILFLLGPNGAGKTTTIEILGADPGHGDEEWRARVGVVLQSWRDHRKWHPLESASGTIVLRRMARRESGSSVAKRREEALQRVM